MIFPPLIHNSFHKKLKPAFDLGPFVRPESDRSPEQSKVAAACPRAPDLGAKDANKRILASFNTFSSISTFSATLQPIPEHSQMGHAQKPAEDHFSPHSDWAHSADRFRRRCQNYWYPVVS
jgi:hypothetical protein